MALSSGEAEYYAMVKGAIEGLGMQTLAQDLGWQLELRLHVESSAAKAIASRNNSGGQIGTRGATPGYSRWCGRGRWC